MNDLKPDDFHVTLMTGPEGGFSDQERELAIEAGFIPIRLGKRILRTETAFISRAISGANVMGRFYLINMNLIKTTYYSLVPLLILLFFVSFSALLSYIILMVAGDVISMRKIVSKGAQIFLLLSIFPLRHYLKLTWADIGFAPRPQFLKQLGYGMVLGLLTLMPVMITLYIFDINVIDQTKEWTTSKIIIRALLALLLATLISFGEEPIFSGILLAGVEEKNDGWFGSIC